MEEEQQRREKEKEMWNLKQEKRLCSAWVLTGQEISAKHLTSKCWVVVSIKYSSYKSISFEHAYVMSWISAGRLDQSQSCVLHQADAVLSFVSLREPYRTS